MKRIFRFPNVYLCVCIFVASQVFGVWVTPYSDVPPVTVILEELRAPSKFLPLKHFIHLFEFSFAQ